MSQDANDNQAQTEPTQTAPESQPAQGSDTQTAEPGAASVPAQQAQGVQQQPPMIPKWRLDEVLEQNRQLKAAVQQQQPQAQPKPASDGAPKQDDFQTYEDYLDARAAYRTRQEIARIREEETQRNQAKGFEERVKKADETFTEKIYAAATKKPELLQKIQNAPALRPDIQLFGLKESDTPDILAEHLADNPMLILQLNQMPMEKALREIGKIEAKLTGSSGQPPRKPSAGIPALDAVGAGNKPGPRTGDNLSQDDVIAKLYGPKS